MVEMNADLGLFLLVVVTATFADEGCIERRYDQDSIVCVCNSSYCDTLDPITDITPDTFWKVVTNKEGLRFNKEMGYLNIDNNASDPVESVVFAVHSQHVYQDIIGFGAAFTDSAGLNLKKLSEEAQTKLLLSYFSSEGIEYNIGRVPIAGTDFSTHPYSYDDIPGDVELEYFALVEEDYEYKIPVIKKAREIRNSTGDGNSLKLFASPWAPPYWMKRNNKTNGGGFLIKDYKSIWAKYFIRFLEEYNKEDIQFWALTIQNEPTAGYLPFYKWNSMAWTPWGEGKFVRDYLGPALEESEFSDTILISMDDQRFSLPFWGFSVFSKPDINKWYKGVALHWYADKYFAPDFLDYFHRKFPDYFILYSEACEEDTPKLGKWYLAERYAQNILEDLTHHVGGWVDWNFALDMNGGPNWANNFVDAPIIINEEYDEFYKQPSFYVMGHFSKFLPRESRRINMTTYSETDIDFGAFVTPDGTRVAILLNFHNYTQNVDITDEHGNRMTTTLSENSINTILW